MPKNTNSTESVENLTFSELKQLIGKREFICDLEDKEIEQPSGTLTFKVALDDNKKEKNTGLDCETLIKYFDLAWKKFLKEKEEESGQAIKLVLSVSYDKTSSDRVYLYEAGADSDKKPISKCRSWNNKFFSRNIVKEFLAQFDPNPKYAVHKKKANTASAAAAASSNSSQKKSEAENEDTSMGEANGAEEKQQSPGFTYGYEYLYRIRSRMLEPSDQFFDGKPPEFYDDCRTGFEQRKEEIAVLAIQNAQAGKGRHKRNYFQLTDFYNQTYASEVRSLKRKVDEEQKNPEAATDQKPSSKRQKLDGSVSEEKAAAAATAMKDDSEISAPFIPSVTILEKILKSVQTYINSIINNANWFEQKINSAYAAAQIDFIAGKITSEDKNQLINLYLETYDKELKGTIDLVRKIMEEIKKRVANAIQAKRDLTQEELVCPFADSICFNVRDFYAENINKQYIAAKSAQIEREIDEEVKKVSEVIFSFLPAQADFVSHFRGYQQREMPAFVAKWGQKYADDFFYKLFNQCLGISQLNTVLASNNPGLLFHRGSPIQAQSVLASIAVGAPAPAGRKTNAELAVVRAAAEVAVAAARASANSSDRTAGGAPAAIAALASVQSAGSLAAPPVQLQPAMRW